MNVKGLEVDIWRKINGLPRWRDLSVFISTMKLPNISASGSNISSIRSSRATNTPVRENVNFRSHVSSEKQAIEMLKGAALLPSNTCLGLVLFFKECKTIPGHSYSEYNHPRSSNNTRKKGFSYQLILEWICPCWLHILPVACIQDPSQILAELPLD